MTQEERYADNFVHPASSKVVEAKVGSLRRAQRRALSRGSVLSPNFILYHSYFSNIYTNIILRYTLVRPMPTGTKLSHSFRHLMGKYVWHICFDILFWPSSIWHSIQAFCLASILTSYLASCLASIRQCPLRSVARDWGPAVPTLMAKVAGGVGAGQEH